MAFMYLLLILSSYAVTIRSSLDELPVHPGVGGFYKGPNSETIIKGPDGSIITVETEGGSILAEPDVTPVLVQEPTNLQTVTPISDIIATCDGVSSATVVAIAPRADAIDTVDAQGPLSIGSVRDVDHTVEIVRPDPHLIETEIVDAPPVEPLEATDLVGPSGVISTRGSSSIVSGPASTTISEPARVFVATPLVAAVPVVASVKTPLRSVPVVEIVPDLPPPINSFVLQTSTAPTVTVTPLSNEVSVSPELPASTLSPLNLGGTSTVNYVTEFSNTASTERPEAVLVSTPVPGTISSTISNVINVINPQQNLATDTLETSLRQPAATVEAASSFGVIDNRAGQIFSTPRPELSVLTTASPTTLPELNRNSLNYAIINNGQLSLNPSSIPTANIIPPEIGLSTKDANQLEHKQISSSSVISVSSTEGTAGTAEVGIANRVSQVGTIPVENQAVQIINNSPGIPSGGLLENGLANYGIDSSKINLAPIPLSSATRLSPNSHVPVSLEQEIEDTSGKYWNRYGRGAQNDKRN